MNAKAALDPTRVVDARFVAGAVDSPSLPPPVSVEVAFAGRSNVGKSSLLNALMERKSLARTSRTPGCTRQINLFEVRCADGLVLRLVDLPGYGWAQRSKEERVHWQTMIESYLTTRINLRAVAVLVDVRRGLDDEEKQLLEFLESTRQRGSRDPLRVILVATKIDKLGAAARPPALAALRGALKALVPPTRSKASAAGPDEDAEPRSEVTGFSAVTGEGRAKLWGSLRRATLGSTLATG